jgi:hypothetical protein
MPSSVMLRLVDLVRTDVSEDIFLRTAFFIVTVVKTSNLKHMTQFTLSN